MKTEAVKRNIVMRTFKFFRAVIVCNKFVHGESWGMRKVEAHFSDVLLATLGFT